MTATATASATSRNGEGMERTRGRRDSADNAEVKYTVREMFDNIQRLITELTRSVKENDDLVDRRLVVVEQVTQKHDASLVRVDKYIEDFNGMERRFHDHEKSLWHTQGESAVAKLSADVKHLLEKQLTDKAVTDFMLEMQRQQRATRQWLVTLTVGAFFSLITMAATLYKLLTVTS